MLNAMLSRFVRLGRLTVAEHGKPSRTYGDGSGPEVAVRVARGWSARLAMNPDMALGEAYMEGGLVMEQGSFWDLCELIGRNFQDGGPPNLFKRALDQSVRTLQQWNDRRAARRNVAHHYDLSHDLYRRFLDSDLQYSCAYFARPASSSPMPPQPQPMSSTFMPGSIISLDAMCTFLASCASSSVMSGRAK